MSVHRTISEIFSVKMEWPWNRGYGLFNVIENGAIR